MKNHKNKIIAAAIIAVVLVSAFLLGGNAPGLIGVDFRTPEATASARKSPIEASEDIQETPYPEETPNPEATPFEYELEEIAGEEDRPQKEDGAPMTAEEKIEWAEQMAEELPLIAEEGDEEYSEENGMFINEDTGKDNYQTNPVPENKPVPINPQDTSISDKELSCTLSVRCDTILQNISWLDKEKRELIPVDGVIFAEQTVTFYEGESVFNLLMREMKKNKIHMEYTNTPIYNSAYIEGINNIYELDCGELSGWMYKVNDWFPNYGCSRYQLQEGDKVELVYTCDLGIDVGGYYSARNGK